MKINVLIISMIFLPILLGFLPLAIKNIKKINLCYTIVSAIILILNILILFNIQKYDATLITIPWFAGIGISFNINATSIILCIMASIIWLGSSIFSLDYFVHAPENLRRYYSFFILTFGATLAIFLANDLFTLFIFFELMSFASYPLVVHNQDEEAISAGNSYLTIAVIGGITMLMGIFILNNTIGTLIISDIANAVALSLEKSTVLIAGILIFVGFAAKAGMFLLNGWLPKAHPAAPAPASAILSGILIKTGAYGIVIVTLKILSFNSNWFVFLLVLSLITMLVGAVSAFFSNNLKQVLAYSSMSQMGFIVTGIAMTGILHEHGAVASYGSILHMFNHTLIKLVLFTCAGIVYKNMHSLDLNKIKGYGRNKPYFKLIFATASLGIMGIPGFSGYISKTLLHESIVEKIWLLEEYSIVSKFYQLSEMIFLLAGGFTIAYMIKLFVCIFIEKPEKEINDDKNYTSLSVKIMLGIIATIILAFGLVPHLTMDKIGALNAEFFGVHALESSVNYFSIANLKGALVSLLIGLLLYFGIAKVTVASKQKGYNNPWNQKYTIENIIYKPLIFTVLPNIFGFLSRILDVIIDIFVIVINKLFFKSVKVPDSFLYGKEEKQKHNSTVSITKSLSYSLLLFGLGFVITMLYLLIVEFRI